MLSLFQRSAALALLALGCQTSDEPIDPVWGKQVCSSCRMLVSDPTFAAELVDGRRQRHFFDDIGCLDAYLVEHAAEAPRGVWVRSGSSWLDAHSARYRSGAASPMDYGFVASEHGPLDFAAVRRQAASHRQERAR